MGSKFIFNTKVYHYCIVHLGDRESFVYNIDFEDGDF
jgi:hypothetical protein